MIRAPRPSACNTRPGLATDKPWRNVDDRFNEYHESVRLPALVWQSPTTQGANVMTNLIVIDGKTNASAQRDMSDESEAAFDRAYAEMLQAAAALANAECSHAETEAEEETLTQVLERLANAERQLVLMPASTGIQLKQKFELLEKMICHAEHAGAPSDHRHLLMLASVKADLLNMDI
jgi:hypothetical protein